MIQLSLMCPYFYNISIPDVRFIVPDMVMQEAAENRLPTNRAVKLCLL